MPQSEMDVQSRSAAQPPQTDAMVMMHIDMYAQDPAAEEPADRTIWQVEFNKGMWWDIPYQVTMHLETYFRDGAPKAGYTWDWGDTRAGSWQPDGQETSINRYEITFSNMMQKNIDNGRTRRIRRVRRA